MKKLGRYRLTQLLGQGGMGDVYAAVAEGMGGFEKRVCVKVMNKALAGNERAVELFLREARLAARLTHPNIVQIFELGRENTGRNAQYFLAMEMLDGMPWHEIAQRYWRHGLVLPLEVIVHACAQAAEALEYAHTLKDKEGKSLGIVHRDISPDNLFLTLDGSTKVLDFGIAKAVSHDATSLTEKGELRGKLPYMPPEQVRTEDVDGAADVWALGITLFYLSTAQRPFDRDTPLNIMNAIIKEPAILATAMNPMVPRGLADVIARCVQKAPKDRWPSARAVRDALIDLVPVPFRADDAKELLARAQALEAGDRRPLSAAPSAPTMSWEKRPPAQATLTATAPDRASGRTAAPPSRPAAAAQRPEDRLPQRRAASVEAPRAEATTVSAPLLTADESADSAAADSSEEDGFLDDAPTLAEMPSLDAGGTKSRGDSLFQEMTAQLARGGMSSTPAALPQPPRNPAGGPSTFAAVDGDAPSSLPPTAAEGGGVAAPSSGEVSGMTFSPTVEESALPLASTDAVIAATAAAAVAAARRAPAVSPSTELVHPEHATAEARVPISPLRSLPVWAFAVAAFAVTILIGLLIVAALRALS
jgi:serine/threonine protein kinase